MIAAVHAPQANPVLSELKAADRIIANALAAMPSENMPTWRRLNAADGVSSHRGIARNHERVAVIQEAERGTVGLLPGPVPEPVKDLMAFYDAKTPVDLIYAMEQHVASLQDRLRQVTPGANFYPQRVREG